MSEDNTGVGIEAEGDSLVVDLGGVEADKGFEVMPKANYPIVVDDLDFKSRGKM